MRLDSINFRDGTSWISLKDLIYPKNSMYFSCGSNVPGNSIGGSWTALGGGAVLALSGKNGFASPGGYGGNLKISVNQMPSHSHKPRSDRGNFLYQVVDTTGETFWKGITTGTTSNSWINRTRDSATTGGQNYLPYHYSVKGYYRNA